MQQQVEKRSKKYIQSLNLIYFGSRDGLNAKYWIKVNGKNNLLIILKSSISQIFGGYSPCYWYSYLQKYMQDDSLISFLFSQTKNEIFELNQAKKQYAIFCNYGPIFGGGHDLLINSDFRSGVSSLGNTYLLNEQYKQQYNTHLFGEQSPKIIECEVYELILK